MRSVPFTLAHLPKLRVSWASPRGFVRTETKRGRGYPTYGGGYCCFFPFNPTYMKFNYQWKFSGRGRSLTIFLANGKLHLSHHTHLPCGAEITGFQDIEIDSASDKFAGVVTSVPVSCLLLDSDSHPGADHRALTPGRDARKRRRCGCERMLFPLVDRESTFRG